MSTAETDNGPATRWIFGVYATLMIIVGIVLLGGAAGTSLGAQLQPAELVLHHSPASPFGQYVVPRIVGSILLMMGLIALAFRRLEDPEARRCSLNRFATAHVAFGVLFSGIASALLDSILPAGIIWAPFVIGIVLGFFAVLQPPARRGLASMSVLRSRYEAHILEAARREERVRLARDLHDAVKQQLFAIQTSAATVDARLEFDPAGARAAASSVRTSAHEALVEMDALIEQLHAPPMENTGLVEALRKQCEALGYRTGAHVEFTVGALPPSTLLVPGTQEALYRFAQEALANVARHARAREVSVRLGADRRHLDLSVIDDGVGFDTSGQHPGMGRHNMAARVTELGGEHLLASVPGGGTTVTCRVPVAADPWRSILLRVSAWVLGSAAIGFLLYTKGGENDLGRPGYYFGLEFLTVFGVAVAIALFLSAAWYVARPKAI